MEAVEQARHWTGVLLLPLGSFPARSVIDGWRSICRPSTPFREFRCCSASAFMGLHLHPSTPFREFHIDGDFNIAITPLDPSTPFREFLAITAIPPPTASAALSPSTPFREFRWC